MKFILISAKCRDSGGELIEKGQVYKAKSKAELFEKYPSLKGKVEVLREAKGKEGDDKKVDALKAENGKLATENKALTDEVDALKAEAEAAELAELQKEDDEKKASLEVATPESKKK